MAEVFAVLILISVLVSLLLPAVQSAREAARRASCANNSMQVGLAVSSYHAYFDQLPTQLSGTDGSVTRGDDNDRRLSIFVSLLPMLNQPELAELIGSAVARGGGVTSEAMREPWELEFGLEGGLEESADAAADSGVARSVWPRGGPEPFMAAYPPWKLEPSVLRCPSDPGIGSPSMGRTNYAACLGDGVMAADSGPMKSVGGSFVFDATLAEETDAAMRGPFVPRVVTHYADITDGLSNTILLGEIATGLGDRDVRTHPYSGPGTSLREQPGWAQAQGKLDFDRPEYWPNGATASPFDTSRGLRRGYRWADGMPLYTGFNTILAPNREITMRAGRDDDWGVLSTSSRHQGGAHVVKADGAVIFISNSIEAGDENGPTVYVGSSHPPGSESPFGVWGAMGTRAAGEIRVHGAAPGLN